MLAQLHEVNIHLQARQCNLGTLGDRAGVVWLGRRWSDEASYICALTTAGLKTDLGTEGHAVIDITLLPVR